FLHLSLSDSTLHAFPTRRSSDLRSTRSPDRLSTSPGLERPARRRQIRRSIRTRPKPVISRSPGEALRYWLGARRADRIPGRSATPRLLSHWTESGRPVLTDVQAIAV